jgi:lysozyme
MKIFGSIKRAPKKMFTTGVTAAAMIAAPFTAHHEGLRLKAYLDPVGVPTICYGETVGVELGDVKTKEECDKLFETRLGYFAYRVDLLVDPEMKPKTHAALTSFAYNVGVGAFQRSTLLKKLNDGDLSGACAELDRWVYAGGQRLNGLIRRRAEERQLCLQGGLVVGT